MGQVITFYSYKGGTGRTMALANIACLLASKNGGRGREVLAVDWDLEAPGLHRFLSDYHAEAEDHPGLIEMIQAFGQARSKDDVDLFRYMSRTQLHQLSLIRAGRFDAQYIVRTRDFDWQELYSRYPSVFTELVSSFEQSFAYTLIDSRTGLCDISGGCTMLLPEKLILVFTPNRQSVLGGIELVRKAIKYRISSEDIRPLMVYPLVSRVELSEAARRHDWRFGGKDLLGYQPLFEDLFREVYELHSCDLTSYFDRVQIPHVPRYAYGEEVAVLHEHTSDRLSISYAYDELTAWLVSGAPPWEEPPLR